MDNNYDVVQANPYLVPAAQGISMTDNPRHESGNALAANAEARVVSEVKAQVLLSKQFPRNAAESMDRILTECQRPTLADAAVYSFPRGREVVSGPSIRLAEVMARNWGNNTYGLEVLERRQPQNGVGYSVLRAFAWDLETNTYISRQFELKHWRSTKSGGYPLTDDRDIYELEANMGSRRMRACILQMIPGDVTASAVAACRRTSATGLGKVMADTKERASLINRTLNAFQSLGAVQKDLEGFLTARVDDWTSDHMLRLKELKTSIDDGAISIGDVWAHLAPMEKDTVISKEQVTELMGLAAKSAKQGEISDWMKGQGIAKYANIPASRFDDVKAFILAKIQAVPAPEAEGLKQIEAPNVVAPKTAPVAKPAQAAQAKVPDVPGEKLPWEN